MSIIRYITYNCSADNTDNMNMKCNYLLEKCPLDCSEVVLDCTLGVFEIDFLLSGGLCALCFACPKCDLSAESQNRKLSELWDRYKPVGGFFVVGTTYSY